MSEPAVLTEVREGVLLVTLNRPEQRNAVNRAVAEGVAAALDRLDALGRDGRARMGAAGRERAEREWAWPHVAARHEALYAELVRG